MQRVDSQSTESLRRRLANRVKTMIKAGGSGTVTPSGVPGGEPPLPAGSNPKPPIPVQEPPTFLEITTASPKKAYPAGPFRLLFKTDADPSYFLNPDAFIPIIVPPSFGQYTGTATVRDGYGVAYFKAGENTKVEDTAEISLELRPNRAKTSVGVEVVEMPAVGTGTGGGESPTPNINPMYVGSDTPFYLENGWDEASVAKVVQTEDETAIFVSSENRRLNGLIAKAQRRGEDTVESIKDFYLEHIAFHALLAELSIQSNRGTNGDEESGVDGISLEKAQQKELERACETVCGIMDQTFDLITTQVSGS